MSDALASQIYPRACSEEIDDQTTAQDHWINIIFKVYTGAVHFAFYMFHKFL